jgi:hypothetical protein
MLKKSLNTYDRVGLTYLIATIGMWAIFKISTLITAYIKDIPTLAAKEQIYVPTYYVAGTLTAVLCFLLSKSNFTHNTFKHKYLSIRKFLIFFMLMWALQLPGSITSALYEGILNKFNLTTAWDVNISEANIGYAILVMLLGPIREEIIFRGCILKGLEKIDKNTAILVSALIFGLMHGSLVQSIYAVFVGLILGYVAAEYGLKYSIALHILSNTITQIMGIIAEVYPDDMSFSESHMLVKIAFIFLVISYIIGIAVIIKYRKRIKEQFRHLKESKKEIIKSVTLSVFTLLSIGYSIYSMITEVHTLTE